MRTQHASHAFSRWRMLLGVDCASLFRPRILHGGWNDEMKEVAYYDGREGEGTRGNASRDAELRGVAVTLHSGCLIGAPSCAPRD